MRHKPRSLQWRAAALADLHQIEQWLSAHEGADLAKTMQRIRAAANNLIKLGDLGRPSTVEGLRELSVRTAPYVIVYRIDGDIAEIVAVFHTASDR